MGEVQHLGSTMASFSVESFPVLIFEFSSGMFAPREITQNSISYALPEERRLSIKQTQIFKFENYYDTFKKYEFHQTQKQIYMKTLEELKNDLSLSSAKRSEQQAAVLKRNSLRNSLKIKLEEMADLKNKLKSLEEFDSILVKTKEKKEKNLEFLSQAVNQHSSTQIVDKRVFQDSKIELQGLKLFYQSMRQQDFSSVLEVFFRKNCKPMYIFPSVRTPTLSFIFSNKRQMATMLHTIGFICLYFSKKYNISLKYPLLMDGSQSAIIFKKFTEIIRFFHIPNDIEQNEFHVKKGVFFLNENLRQVMNFFSIDSSVGQDGFFRNVKLLFAFLLKQAGVQ